MAKRKIKLTSPVYMRGKFSSKHFRLVEDSDNKYLYSHGRYRTKITADMLPDSYLQVHSRVFWYSHAYVKCTGVQHLYYTMCKENHLFKDDYLYISYDGEIHETRDDHGWRDIHGYDLCICGNEIVDVLLYIEKLNPELDTSWVRQQMKAKVECLKRDYNDFYNEIFDNKDVDDAIQYYIDKKYVSWINGRGEEMWTVPEVKETVADVIASLPSGIEVASLNSKYAKIFKSK